MGPGAVYFFKIESHPSTSPAHYHVIINDPQSDGLALMVYATSQGVSVRRRVAHLPPETLVEVQEDEYCKFTVTSYFDCNHIFTPTVSDLNRMLRGGRLLSKPPMATPIVERLIRGVLASPVIKREFKNLLSKRI